MFYLLTIAIQVLCVIDVIRNGRNQLWIMALVFLPLASTIAYVVLEVYPRFQGNRHVRTARATVAAKRSRTRLKSLVRQKIATATATMMMTITMTTNQRIQKQRWMH